MKPAHLFYTYFPGHLSVTLCDLSIFLTSSDSAASALLGYAQEEQEMFEGEEVETEPSQSSCTAYERVIERLWIIKINLSGHKSLARTSLLFFINLDVEVEKEWKKQFFLVFIGFSILVMLTLMGSMSMPLPSECLGFLSLGIEIVFCSTAIEH